MKTPIHDPRRRLLLAAGAGLLLPAVARRPATAAAGPIEIGMAGTPNGSHVWFRPRGLLIQPGQTVRWINQEAGNVHTVTAYHPDNGKAKRIPDQARAWNSGYLMPGATFEMTFDTPGVYDYFCIPHEHAGMVGRIVVGEADIAVRPYPATDASLPAVALAGFPSVADILADGRVD